MYELLIVVILLNPFDYPKEDLRQYKTTSTAILPSKKSCEDAKSRIDNFLSIETISKSMFKGRSIGIEVTCKAII